MLKINMIIRKIYEANPALVIEVSGDDVKPEELEILHKFFKEDTEILISNAVIANFDMQSEKLKKIIFCPKGESC